MKTSEKKIEEEKLKDSSKETLDPFAVDFFGVQDSPNGNLNESEKISQSDKVTEVINLKDIKGLDWYKDLSKLTFDEVDFSDQLSKLPKKLSEASKQSVQKTFARFTQIEEKAIKCDIQSVSEVKLEGSLKILNKSPQVFLTFQNSLSSQSSLLVINAAFASSLIDLALGGKGVSPNTLRQLSAVEHTIMEFFVLTVFSELNLSLEKSAFNVVNIENELQEVFAKNERGAEILLNFAFGKLTGNAALLLSNDFLQTLHEAIFVNETPKQKYTKLGKISNDLATNVYVGETQVNANDLLYLEKNDVVLIEKTDRNHPEEIKVFVGDSTNYYLKGSLQTPVDIDESDILSEEYIFEVKEIISEKDSQSQLKREIMDKKKKSENKEEENNQFDDNVDFKTQEIETEDATIADDEVVTDSNVDELVEEEFDESALESMENVMINLRVNLGGRRLSLKELQKIRIGQIIELGCRPNDPVEIVTDSDNRPIATGELIEIEGQLGVRLTKVFV